MKNFLNTIKLYVFGHKILSVILLIVLIFIGRYVYQKVTSTAGDTRYITTKVEKGTIIASVTGTGQVSTSDQIDIKSKVSGEITWVGVSAGQTVSQGQSLLNIDSKNAQKAVRDAQVNLEGAKISLEKLKIQNSNQNLSADLLKAYDDAISSVAVTFSDLTSQLNGLDTILAQQNLSDNVARVSGTTALNYRNKAESSYYEAKNSFEKSRINFVDINHNSPKTDIENILNKTYDTTSVLIDAIKNTKNFVDYIAEDTNTVTTFISNQSTLASYLDAMNSHFSSLSLIKKTIQDSKDSFSNSDLDIQSAELSIKQKENALQDAKDNLADYTVRAPFSGVITVLNAKLGDTVPSTVATIITNHQLAEISLNEVDVAKIKIGEKSILTFDAIPDLSISGKVEEVDSVGAIASGVVTYNIKVSFDTQDSRVKPSMSVSAAIITDIKKDVLLVPNSAVKSNNNGSYVEMFNIPLPKATDGLQGRISTITPNKIQVQAGLSNDSQTEIISGIKEGDEVVSRTILPSAVKSATTTPSLFGSSSGSGNRAPAGATPRGN
ncbi:MAG: efflux RND transporter periplasmic adaptor subunit [Candidatus Nomurabacteria bacterium]|nr:efflux RND transporter periplasmic adaptor subunit [Candidatus Nomurabacteria bacterium]